MSIIIFSLLSFLLTFAGVEIFRRWSIRKNILDIPNDRSSHKTPVPRGGGVVIVTVTLSLAAIVTVFNKIEFPPFFFISAILIAVVSWFDDLRSVPAVIRFAVHSIAALLVIYSTAYPENLYLPLIGDVHTGIGGVVLTYVWIVWLINAYNFMDGIDGIASAQCIVAGIGWAVCGLIINAPVFVWFGTVLASSGLGFFLHNREPAKIFMGDVGSAYLGFCFAVIPLLYKNTESQTAKYIPIFSVLCVLLFIFDTVFTFIRRLIKGEKVWEAHRSHIYQRLVISGFTHTTVTILYSSITAIAVIIGIFLIINHTSFEERVAAICLLIMCLIPLIIAKTKLGSFFSRNRSDL